MLKVNYNPFYGFALSQYDKGRFSTLSFEDACRAIQAENNKGLAWLFDPFTGIRRPDSEIEKDPYFERFGKIMLNYAMRKNDPLKRKPDLFSFVTASFPAFGLNELAINHPKINISVGYNLSKLHAQGQIQMEQQTIKQKFEILERFISENNSNKILISTRYDENGNVTKERKYTAESVKQYTLASILSGHLVVESLRVNVNGKMLPAPVREVFIGDAVWVISGKSELGFEPYVIDRTFNLQYINMLAKSGLCFSSEKDVLEWVEFFRVLGK